MQHLVLKWRKDFRQFVLGIFADTHAVEIEKVVIKTEILQALSVEDVVC